MGDQQCGLCLSCGAPFLPSIDDIDFFNRQGNLSLLFLDTEFKNNRDIRRIFRQPKLMSKRHQAHIFHQSHHAPAIDYMCNMHVDDGSVGFGVVPAAGVVITNVFNQPLLYFRSPTAKGDKGPEAATWTRPSRRNRLKMGPLLNTILRASGQATAMPLEQNLDQTYLTCDNCNYVMTQLADFRFLLGFNTVGTRNTRGTIIQGTPIEQYKVNAVGPIDSAYGNWTFKAPPANVVQRPCNTDKDSEVAHVAYYLHLCLPHKPTAQAHDAFHPIANARIRGTARMLYIEQSWLILEIACLALSVEEGRITQV